MDVVSGNRDEVPADEGLVSRWLVVGLGNPGKEYENTYHNLGRIAAITFADKKFPANLRWHRCYGGLLCHGHLGSHEVYVFLPQCFMNLSGEAVRIARRELRLSSDKIIVIHDDMDIEPGMIRIKKGGGDGGHKGVGSCIKLLSTADFVRVRIGIGRHPFMSSVEYVLSKLLPEHIGSLSQWTERAIEAVEVIIKEGLSSAMGRYNRRMKRTPFTT